MGKTEFYNFVIVIAFSILSIAVSEMCDPNKNPSAITIGERIYYSQHIVVGTVQDIIRPDPKYQNQEKAFGAKFTVKCIYKGGAIPEDITIVGAGMVSGKCHANNITKDGVYIMYLNKDDSQEKWFEPAYLQNDGGDQFIDEITFECNMTPIPPIGKEGTDTECPASENKPGFCDTWTPPPTTKAPVTLKPTPEPEPTTAKPETPGKGSQSSDGNGSTKTLILSFVSLFVCLICSVLL